MATRKFDATLRVGVDDERSFDIGVAAARARRPSRAQSLCRGAHRRSARAPRRPRLCARAAPCIVGAVVGDDDARARRWAVCSAAQQAAQRKSAMPARLVVRGHDHRELAACRLASRELTRGRASSEPTRERAELESCPAAWPRRRRGRLWRSGSFRGLEAERRPAAPSSKNSSTGSIDAFADQHLAVGLGLPVELAHGLVPRPASRQNPGLRSRRSSASSR